MGAPALPTLGYVPGQMAPGDFRPQADALRKAMKGFGTDEKVLIQVLSSLDPLQMAAVRDTYSKHLKRDLYNDVKSETGSFFGDALLAIIEGPLQYDISCVHEAVDGVGTKEWLLNDVLLGRSNTDLLAIKDGYRRRYGRDLSKDVEDDLSQDGDPLQRGAPLHAARGVRSIHNATVGRMQNNVIEVCGIFARSSDNELRAINKGFRDRYNTHLEKHLDKEFSGHMEDALLHMLRTAIDPGMRDAILLDECMKGMGTKDERLAVRVVRLHWNPQHKAKVKEGYRRLFKTDLIQRIKEETSGDFERLLVALLQ
ncbi:annexin ANXC3.2 [Penicillium macrosclerotiorum]|uniref:annexin ANXC3.2 n=1 Tax=Penicillium macrosclerotiorum TaxID=303699 RepID=UPI0025498DCA|nr:annexin ANXC3.2 [Penicillium macrosclerotiorum]KAJ5679247.1 annexin ANXC3.2 [Penicillium macrosclerotiorum]